MQKGSTRASPIAMPSAVANNVSIKSTRATRLLNSERDTVSGSPIRHLRGGEVDKFRDGSPLADKMRFVGRDVRVSDNAQSSDVDTENRAHVLHVYTHLQRIASTEIKGALQAGE